MRIQMSYEDMPEDVGSMTVNDLYKQFADKHGKEIAEFTGITDETEYQLDNFGPGSAWLDESPFCLSLEFSNEHVTLVISGTQQD